jgi:hypothetical protein
MDGLQKIRKPKYPATMEVKLKKQTNFEENIIESVLVAK